MEVNNLCFDSNDFLKVLGDSEVGDFVYFINEDFRSLWRGSVYKGFFVISIVKESLEIQNILDRFEYCPLSLGTSEGVESGRQKSV